MKDKEPNGYKFDLHMDFAPNKDSKKIDDTLDFYKENLPLNAVEKLMNESQVENNGEENQISKSSYNQFISSYKETDSEKTITRLKMLNQKKRTRNEAEEEFLNDIQDKHEAFDYDYSRPKRSWGRLFIAFLFIVFLCVIAALVYKVNDLSNQLTQANSKINDNVQDEEKLQQALIENENLKKMVEDLSNGETTTSSTKKAQTDQNTQASVTQPSVQPASDKSNVTSETTYVVKSGDTLSSISSQFYGSPNFYNKIIERNKLSSENINEGQKLIIPEK